MRWVLVVALIVPLLIAGLGWPMFVRWLAGSGPAAPPETAGLVATAPPGAAAQRTVQPGAAGQTTAQPGAAARTTAQPATTARTTAAPVTAAQPTATAVLPPAERATPAPDVPTPAPVRPEATRVSQGAQADTGPTAAVATFYALVERHEFDTAAQLWTPRMRAEFPPTENIDRRFAQTQQLRVNRVEVVSARGEQALVGIDLNERSSAGERHYVGTWSVVHSGDTWLLDQPNLEPAP
jgi:hypothetical protein